jgi:hypothetical protein
MTQMVGTHDYHASGHWLNSALGHVLDVTYYSAPKL